MKDSICEILGRKVWFYEVHDGKMIYALLAHSTWSRLYYPFSLCACQRGDVVVNPNHKYEMLSDEDHVGLFVSLHKSKFKFNPSVILILFVSLT